jgi:arsenate reductase
MRTKKKVLVLCTGNSCRSQMAEAFLKSLSLNSIIFSAGTQPKEINKYAIEVMLEIGYDLRDHSSNDINEYSGIVFDNLLSVCDNAKESCPVFNNTIKKTHYCFHDPADASGKRSEILIVFRKVRDEIKDFCDKYAKENNL